MFVQHSDDGYRPILEGVDLKTLVHGEKTLMASFHLHKGSKLPSHSHPNEQTGYLVSGHMRLTIESEVHDVWPGDSWCIAAGIIHQADIIEETVAIEVFSPVREDYLTP